MKARLGVRVMVPGILGEVLSELVDGQADMEVREERPEVAVVSADCDEAVERRGVAENPLRPALVLVGDGRTGPVLRALHRRVTAFWHPADPTDELLAAIRHAARGEAACSHRLLMSLMRAARAGPPLDPEGLDLTSLTLREREILPLVRAGLANAAIGECLGITEKTVKSHLTHLYRKLCLAGRADLGWRPARRRLPTCR